MTLLEMAASYRESAGLIRVRLIALRDAAARAETAAERTQLERRIRDLNILYQETSATARVMERYYDRRYH